MIRLMVILAVVIVAFFGLWVARGASTVEQPIAFNHFFHLEEVGAECVDCHLYAKSGRIATIPNIGVCADCHEEPQGESEEEMRVVEFIQNETPIPWLKIYSVPGHVYFSHRRHAEFAEIECELCHGAVGEQTTPIVRPAVHQSMDWCIDCHDKSAVTTDCISCHV